MPNNYGPRIVTDGLLMCLDAGNTKSYSGSGTLWTDLNRNNRNGTLTNGATFSNQNGGSIVFDGTDDYIENSDFANNLGEMTVSTWIKATSLASTSYMSIVQKCLNINTDSGWCFGIVQGGWPFVLLTPAGGMSGNSYRLFVFIDFSGVFLNWTHLTFTLTGGIGGTVSMYINGISRTLTNLSTGAAVTNISNTAPVRIGWNDPATFTIPFYGNMANVSIYNRALSASENQQNYNATKGRFKL